MKKYIWIASVSAAIALIGLLIFIKDQKAVNSGAFLFPLLISCFCVFRYARCKKN